MLMDYELYTTVAETITNLIKDTRKEYGINLDMVVVQTDKYENTEHETVTYGLGCSKGLPKSTYYFNAVEDETNEGAKTYYREPVSYYEHYGKRCMMYRIDISTMFRRIRIFEVSYGATDQDVIYRTVDELELGESKFADKVEVLTL